ncbi:AsmA family protein [Bradyrhizobium sp. AUGA SZCCT0169]|uniref:AsmA family protein n=1 Tax=Bradyrhizobium sp. AUGA SZCCT0169 TaxID=2807663 RepID=UPI001BAC4F5A|nr:AsmA-like C-terminal region-containing protein [Bradyrhizobium sp. AUGA SZCCT0169]MBR1245820.1 AsmA family protein [Bradyrhizobium sp. AUGA SZCCT0169]
MQTTLLGLAIAFIIALVAALVGPYFIDWNQFRPQFEAEASRIIGAPVRVGGKLDARLLPAPSLQLRAVTVGGANDLGKVRADKLDVEFSLGSLMRGEVRATELSINGMSLDLGLDPKGRIDWPASTGTLNPGSLAIDRLNLTGRIALHDAASRSTLELNDIAFSGDVRSLAGSIRGDGNFVLLGTRYPFRVSSGQTADGNGTRVHLNIDPGPKTLSADLDGLLFFEARAPRFEGTMVLASPPRPKADDFDTSPPSWRVSSRVKADYSTARLDALEVTYGADERALKLAGNGDLRFGAAPLLRASLAARQLDADRFFAKDSKDVTATEPVRVLPAVRTLMSGLPQVPIAAQIGLASEQVMLGGRPLQDIAAELHGDAKSWSVRKLEFRAPGTTRVSLSEAIAKGAAPDQFKAALNVESSDPDALMTWLQGRGDIGFRSQKPLRLRGDVTIAPDGFAIDAMKAEIDGGAVEGRIAVSHRQPSSGSKITAELKAERLDLDAATALARSLAGPQAEWPDEGRLSLDIGRAISAGQELRPLVARLGYGPKAFSLDQLNIGQPDKVALEGVGRFDRFASIGKLELHSTASSFGQITALVAPFAPSLAARLNAMGASPGPARVKLALELNKSAGQADHANARAVVDIEAPQLKGITTITARPAVTAIQGIDLQALGRSEIGIESKMSSGQGRALLALLGLDRTMTAGDGPAQFEGSATGAWGGSLRLKAKISGKGLDADADGTAEPWAQEAKGSFSLKVRSADFGPLLDLKPTDTLAQNIGLSSRVSLAGNKLTFDDLDSSIAGSRLRGHVAITLGDEKNIEGEIGLDQIALAPAFALAMGAAGHDAAEPLTAGLVKGWRGKVAFQALRGLLPGGSELQPVSGIVKSDGQSLTFDSIKGKIGGGEATTTIDARQGPNGIALNASVQLSSVDGTALRYRNLSMPAGRASLQMALASQGRSAAALTGALSGSGTVTLESARIAGLDPRAFEVAVRASDGGQAKDDARLKQIVEPALLAGALAVGSAQIPFNIRDGRLRVGATTLDANGVRATVSGGYDIPADQADIRAALALTIVGPATGRPEIQLFAVGTPDALSRSVDVTALSSWLAVRTIDHETRRLDAIERGEPPPPMPAPISLPPDAAVPLTPEAASPSEALSPVPVPGRDPRRPPAAKPKAATPPRPPAPIATAPAPNPPAPLASQPQLAPLPPPIEVRPAPGAAPVAKPRPRPPLSLTPQVANPPPQRPALQNN